MSQVNNVNCFYFKGNTWTEPTSILLNIGS